MGFGEAGQQKSACLIEFNGRTPAISVLEIPEFRRIARIVGDQKQIESQLHQLMQANHEVYVSVIYTGNTEIDSVMSIVDEIVGDSDIVRCLYTQNLYQPESSETTEPDAIPHMTLDDLNEITVFRRLLDIRNPSMPAENRQQLIDTFNELLIMVQEQN